MSSSIIIGGKKSLINCTYCRRDITQQCRIICVECTNVELCGDCFCIGVNVGTHESSHGYKVSNSLDFSIFNADWTAGEELLLLEGK